jgi:hypothetical protein
MTQRSEEREAKPPRLNLRCFAINALGSTLGSFVVQELVPEQGCCDEWIREYYY